MVKTPCDANHVNSIHLFTPTYIRVCNMGTQKISCNEREIYDIIMLLTPCNFVRKCMLKLFVAEIDHLFDKSQWIKVEHVCTNYGFV